MAVYDAPVFSDVLYKELVAEAQFQFMEMEAITRLVRNIDITARPGVSITVPLFPQANDVRDHTDGTYINANNALTNTAIGAPTGVTITTGLKTNHLPLTDLSIDTTTEDLVSIAGMRMGEAFAESRDEELLRLFSDSSITEAGPGAGEQLTVKHIIQAAARLRVNKVKMMGNVSCVLHPYQAEGIKTSLMNAGGNYGASDKFATEALENYFLGVIGGIPIFESPLITIDGNDDVVGAMFHMDAFAFVTKKPITLEAQRENMLIGQIIAGSAMFKAGIVDAKKVVKLTSDATLS